MRKYLRLFRLPRTSRHRALGRLLARAVRDERGGEVLEYALIAGLVVVAVIGTVTCVGIKVLARWNSVNSRV